MNWSIILNAVFIVVMAVGIVFVWRLQRTLNGLYKNRTDMEKFVADFSGSIVRAQKAIRDLQDTARDVGQDVEGQLTRAHGLRDELNFLVEAADKIASRLSDSASAAQHDAKLARAERKEKQVDIKPADIKPADIKPAEKPMSTIQDMQKQKTEPVAPPIKKPEPIAVQEPVVAKTVPTWIKRAEQNAPIINVPVEEAPPVSGLQFGARKAPQKNSESVASTPVDAAEAKEQVKPPETKSPMAKSLAERELLQALEKMK